MRTRLLFCFMIVSLAGFSQNFNVQSAANSYKDLKYTKTSAGRLKDLTDAKNFIDLAAVNEQTSNDPKMWYYRGRIFLEMDQDTLEAIKSLDVDAIEKSAVSFINCKKTDAKKNFTEDCDNNIWISGVRLYNKATAALNKGDYERATRYFNLTMDIIPFDKDNNLKRNTITPDIINYNLAKTGIKSKDDAKAKLYLQKLIDGKYNDPNIYLQMSKVYLDEKDTVKALSYVEQGRKIFDENTNLLNAEINIYSAQGKIDALIEKFTNAIDLNPESELLYYNRGTLYENKVDYVKAETDYKKVIELNQNSLDANYALGTMYFNKAADIIKSSANAKSNEEFDKAKKEYEGLFKKAKPYLEAALDLNPKKTEDDNNTYKRTANSLKQLYVRLGETENYNKMKALLEQK